ncbi:Phage-like element PBSX protein, XkdF [uncultured Caudovirales phage]|uniref:Phage-like element PBSX protein, XkdF n=1 Tax=uncultured Caudovirales phage TaxID=2100421 RepID=A0A6J7XGD2_9CAUD|nr:Phage-like element PBSX protein, XkdF [uncultured Caudovirales phage]CAB5229285.1 Phage-like element PBSX protein, XkdF [uncultured Caudovirales phage]
MEKPDKLPIYKIVLSEEEMGAEYVALVDSPAIRLNWIAFKEEFKYKFVETDSDKRIICGPLMIPDQPIYRFSETKGEHMVVFDKNTIEQIRERFFKNKNTSNVNEMHDSNKIVEGVYMIESFIVNKSKGMTAPIGFEEVPEGTWMASYKVDNEEVWNKVKSGEFKGFSIEGTFGRELDNTSAELAEFETMLRKIDRNGTLSQNFYLNMRTNQNAMKTITELLTSIKEKFADMPIEKPKTTDVKTADGKMITIDGELAVGSAARMGDAIAADGVYVLEDGSSLSIVEGKISEVIAKKVEEEVKVEEAAAPVVDEKAKMEARLVALETAIAEMKGATVAAATQNTVALKAQTDSFKETLKLMTESIEILSGLPKVDESEKKETFSKTNLKEERLKQIALSLSKTKN